MKKQQTYWDTLAGTKTFTTPFQGALFGEYVSENARILDVGCGYGRTLNELYESGYTRLYGIDFSEKMIERGRQLNPDLNLAQNESQSIPFDDKSFDAVVLIAVLTCIADNADQEALMSEIFRVLKKEGSLYISDFLLNEDPRNKKRYQMFEEKYAHYGIFELPGGAVLRHHTKNRIAHLTRHFKTQEYEDVIYTTMNGNKSNGFYYLGAPFS